MAQASLAFTTIMRHNGVPVKRTEYVLGRNSRSETGGRVQIYNRDLGYQFQLDPARQIYTAYRMNEYGSPKWVKAVSTKPLKPSGKTRHIHSETVDTGERRQIFEREARRVITKNRTTRDSEIHDEFESEGWYIDPPAAWLVLHPPPPPGMFYYLSGSERDDCKVTEVGKRENGFALLVRRTSKFFVRDERGDSKSVETVDEEEVTELSEAALGRELFAPPSTYRRVALFQNGMPYRLAYRARLYWELLKDSLVLPRKTAEFVR
jgi:hypothetical protein